MTRPQISEPKAATAGEDARRRLLAGIPVAERRMELAGIPTALLEGGEGPPLVLLHGPGEHAAKWFRVLPELLRRHRVVVPDLPGHGASGMPQGALEVEGVLAWLGDLIDRTGASVPVLVGQIVGGAIAARFAARHGERLGRLVLVDSLGLQPFAPAPEFGAALHAFLERPAEDTHDGLWQRCAFDLEALRARMGERWGPFAAYNLGRFREPGVRTAMLALMERFGFPAIPPEELERISVPTALIWGRHDLATPLRAAELASARYGWPLHVIENCADDPAVEQPEAFLQTLHAALGVHSARQVVV